MKMVAIKIPAHSNNGIFPKIHSGLWPRKFMLISPFSQTLCNRCLICWRLSFGWEKEILASGEKRPLIPKVSSQQESRWLSSIRVKAQRTAGPFVTLEEERDHFEIRKSVATTSPGQYEICSDIRLFWVLTVLSLSFGYGFRVEVFQVMEETPPQKTLTDFMMQAQINSLDRKTHSFLAVHRQKPSPEPSLAHLGPSWAFVLQPSPPTWQTAPTPDTHPPIPWTSALNCCIPPQDTQEEESKALHPDPSLGLKYKKELWEEFPRAQDTPEMQHIFLLLLHKALLVAEFRAKPLLPLGKAWAGNHSSKGTGSCWFIHLALLFRE